jgi:flagellar protein FlaJ
MKIGKKEWFGMGAGAFIAISSSLVFWSSPGILYFLWVISLIVTTVPFVVSILSMQNREKELEMKFLSFTRDLVESVKAGAPISKSIINLRRRNYGVLTPNIQKLSNQLSVGITLSNALETFAKDTRSKVISRAVGLMSEAEKAGGKIETILESVVKSVNQIEVLRKEKKAVVSNLVTQGYIIFIVFVIIMLVLEFKILPIVSDLSGSPTGLNLGAGGVSGLELGEEDVGGGGGINFANPLFMMLVVQSLFAGLVIGKISEGDIKNGAKHSFILLTITLLVVTGSRAFL